METSAASDIKMLGYGIKSKTMFPKTLKVLALVSCVLSVASVLCCAVVIATVQSSACQEIENMVGVPRQLKSKETHDVRRRHTQMTEITGGKVLVDSNGAEVVQTRRKRKAGGRGSRRGKRPAIHLEADCWDVNCHQVTHRELTGTVPKSVEKFVRWKPITEVNTKNGLEYSSTCNCLMVRKGGAYYMYAQVHFTLSDKTSYIACIFKGPVSGRNVYSDDPLACTQSYPLRSHTLGDRVKYFSGVFQLSAGDSLYVAVVRARHGDAAPGLPIVTNRHKTYFGGFKV